MKYLYIILSILLFTSCDFPHHTVYAGSEYLVVYKTEKVNDEKYGIWQYAITDATGKNWTLRSFEKFNLGDTLCIKKINQ